ncbi:hypothetical protein ASB57_26590 [Bordetella sp. N]|nr:hypothetical protein ASB57_26590 [Bordetella sp. N]
MKVDEFSRSVREKLPQAGTEPLGFKTLKVSGSVRSEAADGTATSSDLESTYINDQNDGLVRGISHQTRNGLPYLFSLDLTYRGLVPFMRQSGLSATLRRPSLDRAREINAWPGGVRDVPEHGSFTFEWESTLYFGSALQMHRKFTCVSGENYPAFRFMPHIPGDAIDVLCTSFNENGVEVSKEKAVFLRAYGMAVTVERTSASAKFTVRYKTLTVE